MAFEIKEDECVHEFKYHDDEYGSLGDGGSYEIYKCVKCGKRKYYQLPD